MLLLLLLLLLQLKLKVTTIIKRPVIPYKSRECGYKIIIPAAVAVVAAGCDVAGALKEWASPTELRRQQLLQQQWRLLAVAAAVVDL